ncbi:TMEM175 family protein [Siphonobacter sp. SORGH_AS_1065]|uniref:TMEM175 family protein n=1 Tax=Siphonobacter sp. SORGH_AS_1065 TaxID=3041795 RepID=UPI002787FE80|nr:TMEM175 family protein [Siphonobacter sp. SORGH_AS_1065]MDQ1089886.1 putative membrane protein [Siphonobacter sp. SORGH_AS_1065]
MENTYNKIAGHEVGRIIAISDAVFGVAMTLLVLEIKVPEIEGNEHELAISFLKLMSKFLVYFLSFMTAGIFWMGQAAQFQHIKKSDRHLNWINLTFLLFVSVLPFTTAFLGDYIDYKFAIGIYWLNIFLLGLVLYINWNYATSHGFVTTEDIQEVSSAIKKRIFVSQNLYLIGALLCFVSSYLAIAVIIMIQLNYAFAFFSGGKNK